jgi:hypothetical protein
VNKEKKKLINTNALKSAMYRLAMPWEVLRVVRF